MAAEIKIDREANFPQMNTTLGEDTFILDLLNLISHGENTESKPSLEYQHAQYPKIKFLMFGSEIQCNLYQQYIVRFIEEFLAKHLTFNQFTNQIQNSGEVRIKILSPENSSSGEGSACYDSETRTIVVMMHGKDTEENYLIFCRNLIFEFCNAGNLKRHPGKDFSIHYCNKFSTLPLDEKAAKEYDYFKCSFDFADAMESWEYETYKQFLSFMKQGVEKYLWKRKIIKVKNDDVLCLRKEELTLSEHMETVKRPRIDFYGLSHYMNYVMSNNELLICLLNKKIELLEKRIFEIQIKPEINGLIFNPEVANINETMEQLLLEQLKCWQFQLQLKRELFARQRLKKSMPTNILMLQGWIKYFESILRGEKIYECKDLSEEQLSRELLNYQTKLTVAQDELAIQLRLYDQSCQLYIMAMHTSIVQIQNLITRVQSQKSEDRQFQNNSRCNFLTKLFDICRSRVSSSSKCLIVNEVNKKRS